MSQCFPMNGGDGPCSYTNNSTAQGDSASALKDAIKDAVINNLDLEKLLSSSSSKTFAIADLGCSVGPNTFYAMQTLIEAVQHKYNQESDHGRDLEFQVLFNDQIGNDFNTLFASLPHPRNYLAAAVPGSFHARLFPSSSIHIAYSSYAVHCLSKIPEEVQVKNSPAWNAGRIYYPGASAAVVKAYVDQFEEDMRLFLGARSQEIAPGGMIMMIMVGVPHREVQHVACNLYNFIGSILMDMVNEGILEREKVDSFNIPLIFPCIEDITRVAEKNGCFEIVKIEAMEDVMPKMETESGIMHFRAAAEVSIINHFGNEINEQLFSRAIQHKMELTRIFDSSVTDFNGLLFVVLKRK